MEIRQQSQVAGGFRGLLAPREGSEKAGPSHYWPSQPFLTQGTPPLKGAVNYGLLATLSAVQGPGSPTEEERQHEQFHAHQHTEVMLAIFMGRGSNFCAFCIQGDAVSPVLMAKKGRAISGLTTVAEEVCSKLHI